MLTKPIYSNQQLLLLWEYGHDTLDSRTHTSRTFLWVFAHRTFTLAFLCFECKCGNVFLFSFPVLYQPIWVRFLFLTLVSLLLVLSMKPLLLTSLKQLFFSFFHLHVGISHTSPGLCNMQKTQTATGSHIAISGLAL